MDRPPAGEMIGQSRRSSMAASSTVSVPTPSRDLSFRRGAFTHNILRLEQSAEEMTAGGSDIGEEIRRMNEAEKSALSRQNSVQEQENITLAALGTVAARRQSTHASTILDVNTGARAGGPSPGGFITSPTGSIKSPGSRISIEHQFPTHHNPSVLTDMMESSFEDRPLQLDLDFTSGRSARPLSLPLAVQGDDNSRRSQIETRPPSGLTYGADNVRKSQILTTEITSPTMSSAIMVEREDLEPLREDTTPVRSPSTDTFQQAQTAFIDFDGIHFSPELEEFVQLDQQGNEVRQVSAKRSSRVPSMMLAPNTSHMPKGAPPPDAGMIYYPAPVPRMLNLPKRLSQLPAANVQARRSQVMSQMLQPDRNSAAWLGDGFGGEKRQSKMPEGRAQLNERLSVANFSNVPPQLRASVFFEHQTVVHDVEVKSESAVATLDNILAASATAPVSAFTDHPYAGDISKTAYAPEKLQRRSTANDLRLSTINPNRKSKMLRSSTAGDLPRASTYATLDPRVEEEAQPGRASRLHGDIAEEDENETHEHMDTIDLEEEEEEEEYDEEYDGIEEYDEDELDPVFAQPTTLLGELQVRKAQQKSRNRTAATAFPNGMHSTLLQLDAVAQINKNKRANQRVALAWEDPHLREDDEANANVDEDVPLGMLYPNKNGLIARKMGDNDDWERPLGLMEKREMEDNEPLSSRRSRLRGEPIRPKPQHKSIYLVEPQPEEEEEEPVHDETLEQRARRLSTKNALDAAIADAVPTEDRRVSTFADEMIDQLNLGDAKEEEAPVDIENETLGQRKARLQREKDAAAKELKQRTSVSNLLTTNPVGSRTFSREHVSTKGTLLYANEQAQAEHKQKMLLSNLRSKSYQAQRPLTNPYSAANMMSPMYNMGMQTSASTPMLGIPGSYFPPQQMAMGYNPQMAMQGGMVNPYAYAMLSGQQQVYPYGGMPVQPQMQMPMQGMPIGYAYGTGMQPTMQQRSAIDQWRSNIAQ